MCLTRIAKKLGEPKVMQFYKIMYRIRPGKKNLYYFSIMKKTSPLEKGKIVHAVGTVVSLAVTCPECLKHKP